MSNWWWEFIKINKSAQGKLVEKQSKHKRTTIKTEFVNLMMNSIGV